MAPPNQPTSVMSCDRRVRWKMASTKGISTKSASINLIL